MNIRILGTRGNIKIEAPHHRLHSGILIDDKILVDVGEKEFLNYHPDLILISHLHPDHAYFIADKNTKLPAPTYAPELHKNVPELNAIAHQLVFDGYGITPLPVTHSLHVTSVGYVIKKGNKSIFYTGDVARFDAELLRIFAPLDMIITEASFIKKGGMIRRKDNLSFGHLGIPDLIGLFKEYTEKIVFTHLAAGSLKMWPRE